MQTSDRRTSQPGLGSGSESACCIHFSIPQHIDSASSESHRCRSSSQEPEGTTPETASSWAFCPHGTNCMVHDSWQCMGGNCNDLGEESLEGIAGHRAPPIGTPEIVSSSMGVRPVPVDDWHPHRMKFGARRALSRIRFEALARSRSDGCDPNQLIATIACDDLIVVTPPAPRWCAAPIGPRRPGLADGRVSSASIQLAPPCRAGNRRSRSRR